MAENEHESLTVSDTAQSLSESVYASSGRSPATRASDRRSRALRRRVDGSGPMSSEGHLAYPGDVIRLSALGEVRMYGRALASREIGQNYHMTRRRYGV